MVLHAKKDERMNDTPHPDLTGGGDICTKKQGMQLCKTDIFCKACHFWTNICDIYVRIYQQGGGTHGALRWMFESQCSLMKEEQP